VADDHAPRAERRRLTHLDRSGRPRMVDVSAKPVTARRAVAEAVVAVSADTLSMVIDGGGPKGDVLTVAELAGVMGGKRTSELIPLCHPLPLTDLVVQVTPDRAAGLLRVRAEAATTGQTGVEIRSIHLASKTGGKSGDWHRGDVAPTAPTARPNPRKGGGRAAGRIAGSRKPRG
jgi:cyclic pyranopterin phosphate synthase